MAEKIVLWDDFSGGEYGDTPAHMARPNQFTGLNVIVYRDGTIGPRPGIKAYRNTDLPSGVVKGAGFSGSPGSTWWLATATNQLWVDDTDNWDQATGTFNATLVHAEGQEVSSGQTYVIADNDDMYRINHADDGSTLTQVTGFSAATAGVGTAVAKFRERLYGVEDNTLWYSSALDFTTWGADNFFHIGVGPEVRFLGWMKDALIIITADSGIWEYRGTPDAKDSLRRLYQGTRHPWVFYPGRAAVLPNDELWFVPVDRDYPAQWLNGFINAMEHLKVFEGDYAGSGNDPAEVRVILTDEDDECLILWNVVDPTTSKPRALIKRDDTWTKIEWGVADISTFAATDRQGLILLTDGGAAGAAPDLYTYNTALERPGFVSDAYAGPGDNTILPLNAYFSLGEWWAPEGAEVTIKNIIIDFVKYDTGAVVQNHMTIGVIPLARQDSDDAGTVVAFQAFDQGDVLATAAGVRDRHITGGPAGGAVPSSGFQVKIEGIVGCAIKAVRVIIDQNPASPRY